jgi:hypothetical protein
MSNVTKLGNRCSSRFSRDSTPKGIREEYRAYMGLTDKN